MDKDRVVERVRKLYAMSQESESSPHEAEIALRRCQSLMDKFGVTLADLETSEFGSSSIGKQFRAVPSHVTLLSSAVALLHDCICVHTGDIEFRGYSIDAEVAGITYQYLSKSMERSLQHRKAMGEVAPGRAPSFEYRVGFGIAVLSRCKTIHAERKQAQEQIEKEHSNGVREGYSLIVRKKAMVEANCSSDIEGSKRRTVRFRPGKAHHAGNQDGASVSLDSQLSSSISEKLTN